MSNVVEVLWWIWVFLPVVTIVLFAVFLGFYRKDRKRLDELINLQWTQENHNNRFIVESFEEIEEQFETAAKHRAMLYKLISESQGELSQELLDNTEQMRMAFVNTNALIESFRKKKS